MSLLKNTYNFFFIIVLSSICYSQVLNHDFVNFDDDGYVYENYHVKNGLTINGIKYAFTTTFTGNFIPLTWLSHMLDTELFGLSPGGHHFTNLFFHILNSILLFFFLKVNTRSEWLSLIVALLFVAHPLHVESVVWISERKDVLSTFWGLLSLIYYCKYARQPKPAHYVLAMLFFVCSLLSKPMLVTLPIIFCLLDFWPLLRVSSLFEFFRFRINSAIIFEKVPFFIVAIFFSVVALYSQASVGAINSLAGLPLHLRLVNALNAYANYIYKTIWPVNLAVIYPYEYRIDLFQFIINSLFLIVATGIAVYFRKKNRFFLFCWLWFIITLLPVIGLIQVGSQALADRYMYFPLIGLLIGIIWAFDSLSANLRVGKKVSSFGIIVFLLILTFLTIHQVTVWKNNDTLWKHTISVTQENWLAHLNYGDFLFQKGELDAAIDQYEKSLKIKPNFAIAYNDIGVVMAQKNQLDDAIFFYEKALEFKIDMPMAWVNLANAYFKKGLMSESLAYYKKAIFYDLNFTSAYCGIGAVMAGVGESEKALKAFNMAHAIDPGSMLAKHAIAQIEEKIKKQPIPAKTTQNPLIP
jgi:Tfp pilus assembly protein PilF